MMRALRSGDRVHCLTVTRGEGSRLHGQRGLASEEVAKVREAELRAAVEVMGVSQLTILDYRADQFLTIVHDEAISQIASIVEETMPDTVLTHNDDRSESPHHRVVCSWTTEAFKRSAKPGAHLFCATRTPQWVERFVPALREAGAFPMFEPATTPEEELAIKYALPDDLLDLKLEAVEKHKSQVGFIVDQVGREFLRESMREEHFRGA